MHKHGISRSLCLFLIIGLVLALSVGFVFAAKTGNRAAGARGEPVKKGPAWEQVADPRALAFEPGVLLVKFKSKAKANAVARKHGAEVVKALPKLSVYKLRVPKGKSAREAVGLFKADPDVVYAQLNHKYRLEDVFPNDTLFDWQYALHNYGQDIGLGYSGDPDDDIDAPEGWQVHTGGVPVGIVDTGIDYTHPDLADNMWTNDAELYGTPGVDDDGNGYVDDVYGYDFSDGDPDPYPSDHWHGTHVAGTVGAVTDNDRGVAGVAWHGSPLLMALKVFPNSYDFVIAEALIYAADMGALVTNNSYGSYSYSSLMYDAFQYGVDRGVLGVCSAGNDNLDVSMYPHYPSSFDNTMSVAATDAYDNKASFSNYGGPPGNTTINVSAPGVDILSTFWDPPGEWYAWASGTSMSSPHVSGMAAVLYGHFGVTAEVSPELTLSELWSLIESTTDDLNAENPGYVDELGTGRINLANALGAAPPPPPPEGPDITVDPSSFDVEVPAGGTLTETMWIGNKGDETLEFNLWDEETGVAVASRGASYQLAPDAVKGEMRSDGTAEGVKWEFAAPKTVDIDVLYYGTYTDEADRIAGLVTSLTQTTNPGDVNLANLAGYDVLVVGVWAEGTAGSLAGQAADIESWINTGGGVVFCQPNELGAQGTFLPTGFDVYVTDVWYPDPGYSDITIVDPSHPIMAGLTGADVSGNFETIYPGDIGAGYSLLALNTPGAAAAADVVEELVAVAAGTYGAGRIAFQTGHLGASLDPGSDLYVEQLLAWTAEGAAPPPPEGGRAVSIADDILFDGEIDSEDNRPLVNQAFDWLAGRGPTVAYRFPRAATATAPSDRGGVLPTASDGSSEGMTVRLADLTGVDILYDRYHGERDMTNFSTIVGDLTGRGATITENFGPITPGVLDGYEILWVDEYWGEWPWDPGELAAIEDWVNNQNGGVLCHGDELWSAEAVSALFGLNYTGVAGTGGPSPHKEVHPITQGVDVVYFGGPLNSLDPTHPAYPIWYDATGMPESGVPLIGGYGAEEGPPGEDAPWLSENPTEGVVPPGSAGLPIPIEVSFDATGLTGGDYYADIVIESNDPDPTPEVVVKKPLTIKPPAKASSVNKRASRAERQVMVAPKTVPYSIVTVDLGLPENTGALDVLGIPYTLLSPADFVAADLSAYDVLYVGWTEFASPEGMDALVAKAGDIAAFVASGGGLAALAEYGSNPQDWTWIPDAGSYSWYTNHQEIVHITNPAHPIMDGLTDDLLSNWVNSTHNLWTAYPGYMEEVTEGPTGDAVLLAGEFGGLSAGRIALCGQDADYHTYYVGEPGAMTLLENILNWVGGAAGPVGPTLRIPVHMRVVPEDPIPPTVMITSPVNGSTQYPGWFLKALFDDGPVPVVVPSGVDETTVHLRIDGVVDLFYDDLIGAGAVIDPTGITLGPIPEVPPLETGPHFLELWVSDHAGNEGYDAAHVAVDAVSPEVGIASPPGGAFAGPVPLEVWFDDAPQGPWAVREQATKAVPAKPAQVAGSSRDVFERVKAEKRSLKAEKPSPEYWPMNVAVFMDYLPWGSSVVLDILDGLGISYDVYGSADMGVVDIFAYDKVITSSVQGSAFWEALSANAGWFEEYVNNGGVLEMHLASIGGLDPLTLPGGFSVTPVTAYDEVSKVKLSHVAFNYPSIISDEDLSGWLYSSHGSFDATPTAVAAPGDVNVLAENSLDGSPSAMEYWLGQGKMLATTQPVEWWGANWAYLENLLLWGHYGIDPTTAVLTLDGTPIPADVLVSLGVEVLPFGLFADAVTFGGGEHTMEVCVQDYQSNPPGCDAVAFTEDDCPPEITFNSPSPGSEVPSGWPLDVSWEDCVAEEGTLNLASVAKAAAAGSSTDPKPGYAAIPAERKIRTESPGDVLLFKDVDPWGIVPDPNEQVLSDLGVPYDVANSGDMGVIDLTPYPLVMVASDQPQTFYDAFDANLSQFEGYVSGGGVLQFQGCDLGYQYGFWNQLPGGVTHVNDYDYNNYVVDPSHPIVDGLPSTITGNYASHDYLTDLPAVEGAHVIVEDEDGRPTTIEYPHGSGTVIATTMTWEIAWSLGWDAGPMLPNAISYALGLTPGPPPECNIVYYGDDYLEAPGSQYPEIAMQQLGYPYTPFYDGDWTGFIAALSSGEFDVAVVDHNNYFAPGPGLWDALQAFVAEGGRLVLATFEMDDYAGHGLWGDLGAAWAFNLDPSGAAMYRWDPAHPIFNVPEGVPDLTVFDDGEYFDDGDLVDPIGVGVGLGGADTPPGPGIGMIVEANAGRTVYNSFLVDTHRSDLDSDGKLDPMELWKDEIFYVAQCEAGPPECPIDLMTLHGVLDGTWPFTYHDLLAVGAQIDQSGLFLDRVVLGHGQHTIELWVNDCAGNEGYGATEFMEGPAGPIVEIFSPADGGVYPPGWDLDVGFTPGPPLPLSLEGTVLGFQKPQRAAPNGQGTNAAGASVAASPEQWEQELGYDDGTSEFPLPGGDLANWFLAVEFEMPPAPEVAHQLLEGRFYMADATPFTAYVWPDDGTGNPGTAVASVPVTPDPEGTYPDWVAVNLREEGPAVEALMFEEGAHFWIGYQVEPEVWASVGVDMTPPIDDMSWAKPAFGGWLRVYSGLGVPADAMIRALVGEVGPPPPECPVDPTTIVGTFDGFEYGYDDLLALGASVDETGIFLGNIFVGNGPHTLSISVLDECGRPGADVSNFVQEGLAKRVPGGVDLLAYLQKKVVPTEYALAQNYPNPFNPETTIEYALPEAGHVTLTVYNTLGQVVAKLVDERQEAGFYAVRWDSKDVHGRNVANGLYLYELRAGSFTAVKRMMLLR